MFYLVCQMLNLDYISNPWFWISGVILIVAFFFYRQNIKQSERSSPGAMLQAQLGQQQQEQEKKEQ